MRILTFIAVRPTDFAVRVRIMGEKCLRILLLLFCVYVLSASPGYTAQVTLAWDPNTEQDMAGYKVYYGTASRVYNWFFDVGNATTYTVTGLPDGATYYFAATAYDTSNIESAYSAEAIWSEGMVDSVDPIVSDIAVKDITIGTHFTIPGSGLGTKKGKVLMGTAPVKILSWNDTSIVCSVKKVPLPSGPYDVIIKPQPYKSVSPIILPGALTVMNPEIGSLSSTDGSPGAEVTITGRFFGTKKGKLYLGTQKCKVVSWTMDEATGESQVSFIIPKKLISGTLDVTVVNKVGSVTLASGFTIP